MSSLTGPPDQRRGQCEPIRSAPGMRAVQSALESTPSDMSYRVRSPARFTQPITVLTMMLWILHIYSFLAMRRKKESSAPQSI